MKSWPAISDEKRGRNKSCTLFVGDLTAGSESASSLNTMVDALDLPANFPPTLTSVGEVCMAISHTHKTLHEKSIGLVQDHFETNHRGKNIHTCVCDSRDDMLLFGPGANLCFGACTESTIHRIILRHGT